MSKIIKDLKVPLGEDLAEKLALLEPDLQSYRILKKSIDARGIKKPEWIYSLETFAKNEQIPDDKIILEKTAEHSSLRPLIVGAGPAGLFAALRLVERGLKPILFERGSPCEKRLLAINKYWRYGTLDLDDNVCFGEGGAGLYSDGKLITRIKSPFIPYVMDRLVQFGAPEEIKYLANPHVGSDKIRRVIPIMRRYLLEQGCEIQFNAKVETLIFEGDSVTGLTLKDGRKFHSPAVILATGHSATDMLEHLYEAGVRMEGKSFALGLRVEHSQEFINQVQYGEYKDNPELGAANYKLTHHDHKNEIGVYSFCMCPGGYILSSGTEADGVVSNGMSNYKRNSPLANAAIVVSINHERLFGKDVFGGMKFRRHIEHEAFLSVQKRGGTKQLPVQDVLSFMTGTESTNSTTSSPSGVVNTRMDQLLPASIHLRLVEALEDFDRKMKGFISPKAQLHGMETRTSCPLRIPRDPETYQSKSHRGLYPAGEGAGYAGGITSAACDGVRIAEAVLEQWR